jgi:hypothetical protein
MNVHMDPSDHWRYTRQALEKLLQAADFKDIVVKPNGGLFLVILNLLGPIWRRIGCIQVVFVPLFLVLNCLFEAVVGDSVNRERYPLGYFFSARAKD